MKKITSIVFIALFSQSIQASRSAVLSCKIPFSPSTPSTPIYDKKGNFQGNCRVSGDKGSGICHAPNEKHKSISILKKKVKHDGLFLKTQRNTGLSWKLLKSFVYQETSLIDKYVKINRITSGDGLGVGYMQLTERAMPSEIRFYSRHFREIYGIDISKSSAKNNKLHHMMLGVSWLLHKFKIRTKWSSAKLKGYFKDVFNKYKDKEDGWGFHHVKNDAYIRRKLKEAVTAYNGLSSRCVVGGRVLTAYGDHVEYYYYALKKDSNMPIPYIEAEGETEELMMAKNSTENEAYSTEYTAASSSHSEVTGDKAETKLGIGIGI